MLGSIPKKARNGDEQTEKQVQETQHAFLVAWGQYAKEIGLIKKLETVSLGQKSYQHTPQGKVLEFLAGTLIGLKYLQDRLHRC